MAEDGNFFVILYSLKSSIFKKSWIDTLSLYRGCKRSVWTWSFIMCVQICWWPFVFLNFLLFILKWTYLPFFAMFLFLPFSHLLSHLKKFNAQKIIPILFAFRKFLIANNLHKLKRLHNLPHFYKFCEMWKKIKLTDLSLYDHQSLVI